MITYDFRVIQLTKCEIEAGAGGAHKQMCFKLSPYVASTRILLKIRMNQFFLWKTISFSIIIGRICKITSIDDSVIIKVSVAGIVAPDTEIVMM